MFLNEAIAEVESSERQRRIRACLSGMPHRQAAEELLYALEKHRDCREIYEVLFTDFLDLLPPFQVHNTAISWHNAFLKERPPILYTELVPGDDAFIEDIRADLTDETGLCLPLWDAVISCRIYDEFINTFFQCNKRNKFTGRCGMYILGCYAPFGKDMETYRKQQLERFNAFCNELPVKWGKNGLPNIYVPLINDYIHDLEKKQRPLKEAILRHCGVRTAD